MFEKPGQKQASRDRGFALIVTISLMVLLTIIAVGLLSLSAVNLRTASQGKAMAAAQANARLALIVALGELQRQVGPDQRITASAEVLGESSSVVHPAWVGVWDSNVRGRPDYTPGRPQSFRRWLVSGPKAESDDAPNQPLPDGVAVVSARDGKPAVLAGRVPIGSNQSRRPPGAFAWWVADESMKARVDLPSDPTVEDDAMLIAQRYAARRSAPEVIPGMNGFDPLNADRLITVGTVGLNLTNQTSSSRPPLQSFLTADSLSLPVDVVAGGFKRDINTLFELPAKKINKREYGVWTGRSAKDSRAAYLYGKPGVTLGARWNNLYTYYNIYKDTVFDRGVPVIKPKGKLIDWHLADRYQDFGDEAGGFRFPRIAKIIYVFSYAADRVSSGADRGKYKLKLVTDAFITVWNPFNARIEFPANCSMFIKLSKDLPMSFEWRADGQVKGNARLGQMFGGHPFLCQSPMKTSRGGSKIFRMEPGETLLFTMKDTRSPIDVKDKTSNEPFYPGVGYRGGFSTTKVLGGDRELTGPGGTRIEVSLKPRNDAKAFNIGGVPTSQYVDFWIWDNVRKWPYYEHRGEIIARADTPFTRRMPEIKYTEVRSVSLAEVSGRGRKQPFGAFVMEVKTAQDSVEPSLAFLHSGIARLSSRIDSSDARAANERFEYRLETLTGWDSDIVQTTVSGNPAGPHHGFIGSGRTFQTGQTHFGHSEIPFLPIISLSQFRHAGTGDGAAVLRATHWGFNSTPLPPYVDHAVGNSYAHPLIPPNSSKSRDLYDQSYLINEVLYDHYFCSSLAPQTIPLFKKKRPMNQVWKEFIEQEKPMLNPRNILWRGGLETSELQKSVFSSGSRLNPNAYKTIGAHLMIKGGFNVNSTSAEAWRAFFASCRHESMRIFDPFKGGGRPSVETKIAKGTPFSNCGVPLGGSIDASPGDVSLHYRGFRDLSDEQIAKLADRMVEEVRKRGPFRTLSEFVNRQLTRTPDLALRGALQAAIDETDINAPLAKRGVAVTQNRGKGYAFPQASSGNSAEGCPGWLTQADILDALGPMITVRGDTFLIRAYGESRSKTGDIEARAWCEATVQRVPEYLDRSENATDRPKSETNKTFGRRLRIVSFRWIPQEDV
jgi:hypothetical protein